MSGDQREDLYAVQRECDTQARGSTVALCRMDANGKLTFAGERGYVHALQAAIAERYFRVESGDTQAGDTHRGISDYE